MLQEKGFSWAQALAMVRLRAAGERAGEKARAR